MHAKRGIILLIPAVLLVVLSGCASTTVPNHWLPPPNEAQKEAYGAWITVEYKTGNSSQVAEGEFIATSSDSIFVLTQQNLVVISQSEINQGKLVTYDSKHGVLGIWTLLGTLSTPSHGWGLIISAPLWIVLGSITTSAQSYEPIEKYPGHSWDNLRKFARFPQGFPTTLDREVLRSK